MKNDFLKFAVSNGMNSMHVENAMNGNIQIEEIFRNRKCKAYKLVHRYGNCLVQV